MAAVIFAPCHATCLNDGVSPATSVPVSFRLPALTDQTGYVDEATLARLFLLSSKMSKVVPVSCWHFALLLEAPYSTRPWWLSMVKLACYMQPCGACRLAVAGLDLCWLTFARAEPSSLMPISA